MQDTVKVAHQIDTFFTCLQSALFFEVFPEGFREEVSLTISLYAIPTPHYRLKKHLQFHEFIPASVWHDAEEVDLLADVFMDEVPVPLPEDCIETVCDYIWSDASLYSSSLPLCRHPLSVRYLSLFVRDRLETNIRPPLQQHVFELCEQGKVESVAEWLKRFPCRAVGLETQFTRSLLSHAVRHNQCEMIQWILDHLFIAKHHIYMGGVFPPFYTAAMYGQIEATHKLIAFAGLPPMESFKVACSFSQPTPQHVKWRHEMEKLLNLLPHSRGSSRTGSLWLPALISAIVFLRLMKIPRGGQLSSV